MVKLDREYVENWSMARDLRILVRTFIVVLVGRGAY
jgi:lipopolysaccharide/colanic/teichoic acid biosynthesis glycosyltransferase